MQEYQDYSVLNGKALVALPTMSDPRFTHSVILICTHDENGTLGLIINKKTQKFSSRALFDDLEIKATPEMPDFPVHIGGPVSPNSGFVLHSTNYDDTDQQSLSVSSDLRLSSTPDILLALAQGNGPQEFILALGYTGWRPGQLESELRNMGWLVAQIEPDFIFSEAGEDEKWHQALEQLGVNAGAFSSTQGRA